MTNKARRTARRSPSQASKNPLRVGAAASFNVDRTRSTIMIAAMLTLMVVAAVLASEIRWLMVDPPAS